MGMRIEKSFVIQAPAEPVWAFLTDPARVASCLPGAAITEQVDAQSYNGTMTVKVGPVTASYRGRMRFERLDAAAREAEIVASGQETRGKGAADMRMSSRVVERAGGGTEVFVTSDVNVVGALAQFGGRLIQDVSDQMFEKFTQGMRRQLEEATPAAVVADEVRAEAPAPSAVAPAATAAAAVAAEPGPSAPVAVAAPPPAAAATPAPVAPLRAPQPPAEENVLDLGAIGAAAAGRAAGRTLRNPLFWVAVAAVAAALWFLLT